MSGSQRTPDQTRLFILDTAEQQLRRHGPLKVTVVDIARASGMSHANVYRFFATKAAILDAITERWLAGAERALTAVIAQPATAAERLEAFVLQLHRLKVKKVSDDPEVFQTYRAVAEQCRAVIEQHLATLQELLERVVRDGVESGEFRVRDVSAAVQAIRNATLRFHHPHLVAKTLGEPVEEQARSVVRLLVAALAADVI